MAELSYTSSTWVSVLPQSINSCRPSSFAVCADFTISIAVTITARWLIYTNAKKIMFARLSNVAEESPAIRSSRHQILHIIAHRSLSSSASVRSRHLSGRSIASDKTIRWWCWCSQIQLAFSWRASCVITRHLCGAANVPSWHLVDLEFTASVHGPDTSDREYRRSLKAYIGDQRHTAIALNNPSDRLSLVQRQFLIWRWSCK